MELRTGSPALELRGLHCPVFVLSLSGLSLLTWSKQRSDQVDPGEEFLVRPQEQIRRCLGQKVGAPEKDVLLSPLSWPLKLVPWLEEPHPALWAGGKKEAPGHGNPVPWPAHMVTGPSLSSAALVTLLVL